MRECCVSTVTGHGPGAGWAALEGVTTHARLLEDAPAARVVSEVHIGIGTFFGFDNKLGPIRLADTMLAPASEPGPRVAAARGGASGSGRLTPEAPPPRSPGTVSSANAEHSDGSLPLAGAGELHSPW
jgi:hypothetical protein